MKKFILISYLSVLVTTYSDSSGLDLPTPEILPKRIYVLEGEPCAVRFDTVVFAPLRGSLLYDIERGPGRQYNDYLLWRPKGSEPEMSLKIGVYSGQDFRKISEIFGEFVYCDPKTIAAKGTIRWLAIGDSLTLPGYYLSQTVDMLRQKLPGVTVVTIGTQTSKDDSGLRHEGRGGWSWERYLEAFPPKSKWQSPFVFGTNGADDFDFTRYVLEQAGGYAPEIITIFLGANDVYGVAADFSQGKIDAVLERSKIMVEKIRKAAPLSIIGIIPPPPCSEQNGFGINYENGVTEWQYRRAMQFYIAGLLRNFDGRWEEGIFIVPGYLGFDPATAYPLAFGRSQNALHPNSEGFRPISLSISAWILNLLSTQTILPK